MLTKLRHGIGASRITLSGLSLWWDTRSSILVDRLEGSGAVFTAFVFGVCGLIFTWGALWRELEACVGV